MATRGVPLLLLWVVVSLGCGASEAEREAQQQALASRVRVAPDGTIVLTQEEREALGLTTSTAAEGKIAGGETVYGVVKASPGAQVEVSAPIDATVAGAPLVVLGQQVRSGTALVRLAPSFGTAERATLAVRRQELRGQVEVLEHRVELQDAAVTRARKLHHQGIESLADLQTAEADAGALRAQLTAAQRELSELDATTVDLLTVRAPESGSVASLDVEAGSTVQRGERLASVLVASDRWVDVGLPPGGPPTSSFAVEVHSRWVAAERIGGSVVVGADGLRHELLALPSARADLEPGATVLVRMGQGSAGGIVLPAAAVVPTAHGEVAFVAEAPGSYRLRRVQVVERGDDEVTVQGDVRAGEPVVVRGAMELWGEVVKAGGIGEGATTAPPR